MHEPVVAPRKAIVGWKAIAALLSESAGFDISADSAQRWSRRANRPLPVRRFGSGQLPRVTGDEAELAAWCAAEWRP